MVGLTEELNWQIQDDLWMDITCNYHLHCSRSNGGLEISTYSSLFTFLFLDITVSIWKQHWEKNLRQKMPIHQRLWFPCLSTSKLVSTHTLPPQIQFSISQATLWFSWGYYGGDKGVQTWLSINSPQAEGLLSVWYGHTHPFTEQSGLLSRAPFLQSFPS